MTHLISLQGVRKTFGTANVLHDLSLDIASGELVGLVGPNGAGKSTLLRILVGIVFRDGGKVLVDGLDPDQDALKIRHRTGYLPGETNVYGAMTGARFLEFAASFHPKPDPVWNRRLADTFELPLRHKVRTYSAGMKQKLTLCATLAPDLPLYLLDEPDRALDATARLQLRDLLRAVHERGRTVLLSSHHLTEIEALASRQVFILAGHRVPDEIVLEARTRLRNQLRVHLRPGVVPPKVFTDVRQDTDGIWRIMSDGDPLAALKQFDARDIIAAELGTAPLEELYQSLTALQEQSS